MSALDPNIIKDTGKLISLYQTNLSFRAAFDRITAKNINTTYLGRPIKLYVEVLANISSGYKADYAQVRKIVLQDTNRKVGELFAKVKPHDFFLLDNAAKSAQQGLNYSSYSAEEIEQINKIETGAKDRKEKGEAYAKREIETLPAPQTPQLPPTPSLTTAGSWSAKVGSFFRRGAGGTAEKAVAGKAATVSAGKIAAKLGINTVVKAGAGFLAKLGISALTGAATAGVGLVVGVAITLATTFGEQIKKLFKYIALIVIALFLILFVSSSNKMGIKMNAFLPPYQLPSGVSITPTPTGPAPSVTVTPGDLASCRFYRAGDSALYNSSLLLNYFQEASQYSGIPAVLLAAIARVESPTIVSYSDADLSSLGCATSITGALGLMQLQPAGTIGYCSECINLGASYLGKTADQLTREDYCDPRKNIIIAAGFILKKTHYMTSEPGNSWNPLWMTDKVYIDKVAQGFYGCLLYGGSSDCIGPYNYGTDLWTSIINCKPSTVPSATPSPELHSITDWATRITGSLRQKCDGWWNNLSTQFSNGTYTTSLWPANDCGNPGDRYWCTRLVIDAYNLAGLSGLSQSSNAHVCSVKSFFENTSNYRYIDTNTRVDQLRPGDVVFMWDKGNTSCVGSSNHHVSIIQSINVEPTSGQGTITTYDANNFGINDTVFVVNFKATVTQYTQSIYNIKGFGQYTGP